MIAVDTNILVYAHRRDSAFHGRAQAVVRGLAEGRASWAIPWSCLHEFLAVVTHPRIYSPPTGVDEAFAQVEAWLDSPRVVPLAEGREHASVLKGFAKGANAVGPRVHDARIAAVCLAHGVSELWSADRDFSSFPVVTRNPLLNTS